MIWSRERGIAVRNTAGRLLIAAAVVGGLLSLGLPAIAAQAAPAGVGDSGQICLTNAPSYCIEANGAGNQVTITNVAADMANFTVVFQQNQYYEWQDGNGRCLREGNGGVVKIQNGSCASGGGDSVLWAKTGNLITESLTIDIMYTKGDANGDDVWATGTPPSGSWEKWNVPT
ncbi:MAG TPA: hypothetical protein VMF87_06765 [Streptosporangiaceae bacterium]|nr:hypothetical protein [Streptosporangiaceae bacterium]